MTTELTKAARQALMECPFCGSEPHDAHHIEYGRWAVTCRCGAKGASANTGPNATDAAKIKAYSDARTAWNTRALTQRPAAHTDGNGVSLPDGWVPLTIEHEPGYPEAVAFGPQRMMNRLKKWLDKHFAALAAQRPAAQTERDILNDSAWIAGAKFGWNCGVEGTRDLLNQCIEQRIKDRAEARASLPAPQQATPAQEVGGPIAASLGDIVALWDQHAPSEYMTAIHMQAKRALAGQQPVSPDMHRWCAYVGGMVAHWVKSDPDALARLGDDAFEAAIAGIIERRLWAMPKPTQPAAQATPEPVPFSHAGHFYNLVGHALMEVKRPDACAYRLRLILDELAALMGQPATPEPVGERWVVVRETALDVGRGNDVRTGGRPELGYALISDAATFGSEGEAVAAIKSASLPVGWVVLPLSRLLPDLGYTRPAPGVPEGLIEYLRHVRETFANGPMANVPQVRGQIIALDVWIDALAAAQAKGGE